MKTYRIAAIFTAFAVLFFLPGVSAIDPPTVSFIPAKPSINSSFIMIANPNAQNFESVSLTWVIPGVDPPWVGSFPKPTSGKQWICYFSNTDPQSTCGPSRFPYPSPADTPYTVLVDAISYVNNIQIGQENVSVNISVGGIPITTDVNVVGTNVYMIARVGASISGTVSYKVYDADTLDAIQGASGTMGYEPNLYGYTKNITLSNGEYFIELTANSATDFGGGIARVVVGGTTPGQASNVSFDNIVYSPVINPGQKFKIETFKITNIGTENLTALSISVAPEIATYLTITPKQTSLEPNESVYLTVELQNVHSSMNISTFASLMSGSTQLAQIPVNLMVSVIGSQNYSSCVGKSDKDLCLGGMCCGEVCRTGGADCCSSSDCSSGEECSSSFKCVPSVIPGECAGKNDSTTCSAGVCCTGKCVECCSDSDCTTGKICTSNKCEAAAPNECAGKNDSTSCTGGICCSEACIEGGKCCVKGDCAAGETCNSNNICEKETGTSGGLDMTTLALVGGGVAVAGVAAYFLLKKLRKKGGEGDEELEPEEEGEDEFSDKDFY